MHDRASELLRIPLLRGWVNKGKKAGRDLSRIGVPISSENSRAVPSPVLSTPPQRAWNSSTSPRCTTHPRFLLWKSPSYGEAGESRAYEVWVTPLTLLNSPPVCSLSPSTCSAHTRL